MDDDQISEELEYKMNSNRPNIVQVSMFSSFHNQPTDKICSLIDTLSMKSQDSVEEERVNKVYVVKGHRNNARLNIQIKVYHLVNEIDLERVKARLESVIDSRLYGAYKGNITDPAKLRSDPFEGGTVKARLSLPANYSPDGNCKRDGSIRPRLQTTKSEPKPAEPTAGVSGLQTSSKVPMRSSAKSSASTSQSKKSSTSNQNNKSKSQSTQPKLFFGQSKTSTKTKSPSESTETSKSTTKTSKNESRTETSKSESRTSQFKVKEESKAVNGDNHSPEKLSDKENTSEKTEPKVKRARVRVFTSSDESDSEPEETSNKKELSKNKNITPDRNTTPDKKNTQGKQVVNKTGLVLDPEDLQNESEDDGESQQADSKKRASSDGSPQKPKRKRRNKKTDDNDDDGNTDETTKNKGSKHSQSFGAVKAGDKCNSMKYVDKTYLDGEGFLVTEKVLEEVPQSEQTSILATSNIESSNKAPDKKPKLVKKSKPVPKQQSSLLSFFKKK